MFRRRNGQLGRKAKRVKLEAPIRHHHSIPQRAEVGDGRPDVEDGEDLRLWVHLTTIVVVDDVSHLKVKIFKKILKSRIQQSCS